MNVTPSVRLPYAIPAVALTLAAALLLGRGDASPDLASPLAGMAQSPGLAPPAAAAVAHAEPCASGASACAAPGLHAAGGAALPEGATATGVPQLLEFEATYCAACATMAPVVSSIVKSCAKASEIVRRVDVGKDEGEALAQHYKISALPTFLAVDAEGQEVFRKVGVQKPAELASIVSEVSGERCSATN